MDKMAKADDVVFAYIQQRIKELHAKKTDLDRRLHNKERKQKEIESNPLLEPLSQWNSLTVQEKHDLAKQIIERRVITEQIFFEDKAPFAVFHDVHIERLISIKCIHCLSAVTESGF